MISNQIDEFETTQGIHVCVRPLLSDDAPHLVKIFEHMGPESRYKRFNQPLQKLSKTRVWKEAKEIAQIEPSRSKGLVAFADLPDEPKTAVAAARYVRVDETTAEAAISVRDDMQRQGIGTRLMRLLVEVAQKDGLRTLVATIQNNNPGIWKLLQSLPCPATRRYDGPYTHVSIDLTVDAAAEPAASSSKRVTV